MAESDAVPDMVMYWCSRQVFGYLLETAADRPLDPVAITMAWNPLVDTCPKREYGTPPETQICCAFSKIVVDRYERYAHTLSTQMHIVSQ